MMGRGSSGLLSPFHGGGTWRGNDALKGKEGLCDSRNSYGILIKAKGEEA